MFATVQRFNNRAVSTSKILAALIFPLVFGFVSSVSFAAVAIDPPLALTLYIESISPFTSIRQIAPASITIPRGVTMKFSVTTNVAVDDFVWSGMGIIKISQTNFDSRSAGEAKTPLYAVENADSKSAPPRSVRQNSTNRLSPYSLIKKSVRSAASA